MSSDIVLIKNKSTCFQLCTLLIYSLNFVPDPILFFDFVSYMFLILILTANFEARLFLIFSYFLVILSPSSYKIVLK